MREGNKANRVASANKERLFSLLEILRAESLKIYKNSAIIYIESERDVTLLLLNKKTSSGRDLPRERGTK